ncbi:MAG: hypothetical protein N4A64_00025 [Marinisporobacter sp.]|nr:hypothetical protein [Marinisporobacter sp.]
MELMKIRDMLLVGFPEIFLGLLFGYKLLRKELQRKGLFHIIFSTIFILSIAAIVRNYFKDIVTITLINTMSYFIAYKIILKFNIRQAVFAAAISMFTIVLAENATLLPTLSALGTKNFFDTRIIGSIPTRLMQFMFLLFIIHFKINFEKSAIFKGNWKYLSRAQRITVTLFLFLSIVTIDFACNYTELVIKNYINHQPISISITKIMIENIIFMLVALILLNRTIYYEDFKDFALKTPIELFQMMLKKSNQEDMKQYKALLDKYMNEGKEEKK